MVFNALSTILNCIHNALDHAIRFFTEVLHSRQSHRLTRLHSTTTTPTAVKELAVSIAVPDRASSLGFLNNLPPELISMVISMLDVQSVVNFAVVSFQAYTLVKAQPEYRALITLAPKALSKLDQLNLIGLHSVADLHAALSTTRCATARCEEFACSLLLSTCDMYCWLCLRQNPSFQVPLRWRYVYASDFWEASRQDQGS